ncbi:anti-sigma factor domain-containing protein [Brachybacterium paraconglomeratum]|uniref:anti-sigma factor domain-containing protein n=1 Tax=Brachybacterium paraconglomeratum TaxID=173362 RepID=UPI0022AF4596|nr:anti-sigma factor [Brachybacterium paraconglomeratum]MCZ4326601.1 anti-sigma factor [Brachybacterium paraconglomeratum]
MNEQKHTMTGAWALDALDAAEREEMRRFLAEDPEAAAEARAFEETAGELAASLPPLAPRPQLKAAVMARIATTRQLSPLPEEDEPDFPRQEPAKTEGAAPVAVSTTSPEPTEHVEPTPPDAPSAAEEPAEGSDSAGKLIPLDRYRASVRRSRWTTVAAGALLLTTIAGVGLWNGERAAQEDMEATLAAMESEQAEAQEEREMLSSILAADDSTQVAVPIADGGSLALMYSREQQAMIVQPDGLEALPADRTYQLWMIEGDDDITSAGLLEDPAAAVMRPGAIPEGVVVGLTIEPAGGSDQPTMDPIGSEVLT